MRREHETSPEEMARRFAAATWVRADTTSGSYLCELCGGRWRAGRRWLYWPVAIVWRARNARRPLIDWHPWVAGADRIYQPVMGWSLHIGSITVIFGKRNRVVL